MKKVIAKKLTITIENISEGKEKGFCATFRELGNSIIMADSLEEIFDLIPDLIKSAKRNNIGVFKKGSFDWRNTAHQANAKTVAASQSVLRLRTAQ